MTIIQSIILGIVQGITEFLPVSSSGHLVLLPKILGWDYQGVAFDAIVHMGTLLAVIIYFRERIWSVLTGIFSRGKKKKDSRRLAFFIIIVSIVPAGLFGFFFKDAIEGAFRGLNVIAYSLIFWGIVLYIADKYSASLVEKKEKLSDTNTLSLKQVLIVAFAQAIALIPGTSRSGITMTAGLFAKIDKKSAAEFSFLMSIPVIALAGLLKIIDLFTIGLEGLGSGVLVVGFFASMISGFFAISFLMKIVERFGFGFFAIYRIILGIIILVYFV